MIEQLKIKPRYVFLTNGCGIHTSKLRSFEEALRDAGVAHQNLVTVSSILPPSVPVISREKGLSYLTAGDIRFCVLSRNETDENRRLISASIGLARPADKKVHGYISEHHASGWSDERTGEYAECLAAEMLASTLNIPFDPNTAWSEKEQAFKASKQIITTRNITQASMGKDNHWVTVIAAAIFVF